MTLTIHDKIEQRSPEWLELRCGMITASSMGKLVTPSTVKPASNDESRGFAALLAAERATGYVEPTFTNADMWRGIEDEPKARDTYSEHYAPATEVGFMVREEEGWRLGYSPDGLVGDDGLIEVKCPRSKTHLRTVLDGEVPGYHMAQIQAGLLVSGRKWLDFISYCGGMPMWTKRVLPDEKWQAAIVAAVTATEKTVEQMVQQYRESVVGLPMTERLELVVI